MTTSTHPTNPRGRVHRIAPGQYAVEFDGFGTYSIRVGVVDRRWYVTWPNEQFADAYGSTLRQAKLIVNRDVATRLRRRR